MRSRDCIEQEFKDKIREQLIDPDYPEDGVEPFVEDAQMYLILEVLLDIRHLLFTGGRP